MTGTGRLDETTPGGKYLNHDETRWVDANGNDLGPVTSNDRTADTVPEPKPARKAAPKKDAQP